METGVNTWGRVMPVVVAALTVAGLLAGLRFCAPREEGLERVGEPEKERVETGGRREIGRSVGGRGIWVTTHGQGSRVVLMMASIHGSEGAGTPLLERLREHLEANPGELEGVTVHLLPVANPDGLASGRRFNRRGVDLNRNFPAENREERVRFGSGALSEPESRALAAFILERRPEVIVTIHQPLGCIDWDGPPETERWAGVLAGGSGLAVKKLGARPGSLGAWYGETLGGAVLTMELPARPPVGVEALWGEYGRGLLAVLRGR